jgi:hypothetical protein
MTDTSKTTESKAEPQGEVDELEKIMSEIEELQNELEASETPSATASATEADTGASSDDLSSDDILKEIQANGLVDESNMEETLAELKSEDTGSSLLDEATEIQDDQETEMAEIPMSNTGGNSGNDGTLSMTLTGNMTLKLKYEFEGQEVTISFADQALRVQMTDGTEFKVPVARIASTASNVKPFKKTG